MDDQSFQDTKGEHDAYRLPVDILLMLGSPDADADAWPDYRAGARRWRMPRPARRRASSRRRRWGR